MLCLFPSSRHFWRVRNYVLQNLTQKSFEQKFADMLDLNASALSVVMRERKWSLQSRFSHPQLSYNIRHMIRDGGSGVESSPRIGIFIQVFNYGLWPEMRRCVETVLEAAGNGVVDVILTATHSYETIYYFLPTLRYVSNFSSALRYDILSFVKRKGADNGVFLQQLLLAKELSLDHEIILKIHTKEELKWRHLMLEEICGSVERVRGIIRKFQRDRSVGLVGPTSFTWSQKSPSDHIALGQEKFAFNQKAIQQMELLSSLMKWNTLPPKSLWTVVAGSCYFVRANLAAWNKLLRNTPLILDSCDTERGCGDTRGFEILLPTLIATRHKIASAPPKSTEVAVNDSAPDFKQEALHQFCPIMPI